MREKYTSVSVMLFRDILFLLPLFLSMYCLHMDRAIGAVIDKVVASVDDLAITKSELDEKYIEMKKINKKITYIETLEGMINRILLLKDARKFRLEGKDDEIIKQYVDFKIRSLIRIHDREVERYYEEHREEFHMLKYEDVYNDVMQYLVERKVNERLKKHINTLREQALISIKLD